LLEAPLMEDHVGRKLPRLLQAYHTAIYVNGTDPAESWTFEFRANKFGSGVVFPQVANDTLTWAGNEAFYCVTKGLLHGVDHWTTMKPLAEVRQRHFLSLLSDFVYPRMRTGLYWYQLFYVPSGSSPGAQPLLADLTCGTGSLALLSYLNETLGIPLRGIRSAADVPFTTTELYTEDFGVADSEDADLFAFYVAASKVVHANGWFRRVLNLYGLNSRQWKYAHSQGSTNGSTYFRFRSRNPRIRAHHAPRPDWKALTGPGGREDPAGQVASSAKPGMENVETLLV